MLNINNINISKYEGDRAVL